jgi:hypothetical protein
MMYRSFDGCFDRVDRSITCIPPARRILWPEFLDQLRRRTGPSIRLSVSLSAGTSAHSFAISVDTWRWHWTP